VNVIRGSGNVYFDTATMLLLIVTAGRLLEASAKNRTSHAIRDLMKLAPEQARVLRYGAEAGIPSGEVRTGDVMVVRPGERIPADGRILSGECLIEESAFTGECRPRPCAPADRVWGGSINCDGLITVEATAVGSEALLGQILAMVYRAQHEQAPVERLAERISTAFIPVVWLVAIAAGGYWGLVRGDLEQAGMSALAVLVVACPCALGLATPMATCLAIGRAARAGVLVRSGEVLERLPSVRTVFFDKTGTLTANDLSVAEVRTADGVSPGEALAWAASLEAGSEHSVAAAIVAAARLSGISLGSITDFSAIPGRGVSGLVEIDGVTRRVTVGSLKLLAEEHETPGSVDLGDSELTTSYVGWDGMVQAAIVLRDHIRPAAEAAVAALAAIGVESSIISGDRREPTRHLADALGITRVFSECSPSEKATMITRARKHMPGVAMVGDGINDAPALAKADVGIAIGGGTDLAREASDVTLLGDDLMRIPWVLEFSRRVYKIIRQNLFWAFAYNSAAMLLAFAGYIHPLIAATAMVVSSIAVIANSMRVLR
jgi:heavy metal translocating P-type ATPase